MNKEANKLNISLKKDNRPLKKVLQDESEFILSILMTDGTYYCLN